MAQVNPPFFFILEIKLHAFHLLRIRLLDLTDKASLYDLLYYRSYTYPPMPPPPTSELKQASIEKPIPNGVFGACDMSTNIDCKNKI